MQSATVARDQLGQVRQRRFPRLQRGQRVLRDREFVSEHAGQVRIVRNHRLQIAAPAQIGFQAPDARVEQSVEGGQGVLEHAARIAITAMSDDAAGIELLADGTACRQAGDERFGRVQHHAIEPGGHGGGSDVQLRTGSLFPQPGANAVQRVQMWMVGTPHEQIAVRVRHGDVE